MFTKAGHLLASLSSSRTNGRLLVFVLCALVFSTVIFRTFAPPIYSPSSQTALGHSAHISSPSTPTSSTPTPSAPTPTAKNRHGIVAFLAADSREKDDSPDDDDKYFVSARMLVYQLLHAPVTKISRSISFTILVTEEVRKSKIQRLRKDGATVIVVDRVDHDGVEIKSARWQQMFTKLRVFDPELLPFEKVLAIDTDVVLTRPIDKIFSDFTVEPSLVDHELVPQPANTSLPELPELPDTFAFAATPETNDLEHDYPFRDPDHQANYFNGGCLLFAPSPKIYHYILTAVKHPDLYGHTFAEQDLLNLVFNREGPMPWRRLTHPWFINWPNKNDIDGGMAIVHSKFWDNGELPFREGEMLAHAKRWEMHGYWAGKERF